MDEPKYALSRRRFLQSTAAAAAVAGVSATGVRADAATTPNLLFVDGVNGSDAADGRLPTTPLQSIGAALAKVGRPGGRITILTPGVYDVAAPIALDGIEIEGPGGPGGDHQAAATTAATAFLRRTFDGDMVVVSRHGGGLRNIVLFDDTTSLGRTGAAIKILATPQAASDTTLRAGYNAFEYVRVTSLDPNGAWERALDVDGSADSTPGSAGVRDLVFLGCTFFGARTPGETVRIRVAENVHFSGGGLYAAPTSIRQGAKVLDPLSTSVAFIGFHCVGDFYSEGTSVSFHGGGIGGNATVVGPWSAVDTPIIGALSCTAPTSVVRSTTTTANTSSIQSLIGLKKGSPVPLVVRGGPSYGDHAVIGFSGGVAGLSAAIAEKITGSGSFLVFGTSDNYSQGVNHVGLQLAPDGHVLIGTPGKADSRSDSWLPPQSAYLWLDEAAGVLHFRVKDSTGKLRTASLPLS